MKLINGKCKICGSSSLDYFAHTAKCDNCGVLLNHPYPKDIREEYTPKKKFKYELYFLLSSIIDLYKKQNEIINIEIPKFSDEVLL